MISGAAHASAMAARTILRQTARTETGYAHHLRPSDQRGVAFVRPGLRPIRRRASASKALTRTLPTPPSNSGSAITCAARQFGCADQASRKRVRGRAHPLNLLHRPFLRPRRWRQFRNNLWWLPDLRLFLFFIIRSVDLQSFRQARRNLDDDRFLRRMTRRPAHGIRHRLVDPAVGRSGSQPYIHWFRHPLAGAFNHYPCSTRQAGATGAALRAVPPYERAHSRASPRAGSRCGRTASSRSHFVRLPYKIASTGSAASARHHAAHRALTRRQVYYCGTAGSPPNQPVA